LAGIYDPVIDPEAFLVSPVKPLIKPRREGFALEKEKSLENGE
jgi:hypothetical protein